MHQALLTRFSDITYAWDADRCRRARLAAEYLPADCATGGSNCSLPAFIDGVRLADAGAIEDVAFVVTRLTQEVRVEQGYEPQLVVGSSKKGKAAGTKYVHYKRNVEIPGLSGPAYLLDPRSGAVIGGRELRSATPEAVADVLVQLLDASR